MLSTLSRQMVVTKHSQGPSRVSRTSAHFAFAFLYGTTGDGHLQSYMPRTSSHHPRILDEYKITTCCSDLECLANIRPRTVGTSPTTYHHAYQFANVRGLGRYSRETEASKAPSLAPSIFGRSRRGGGNTTATSLPFRFLRAGYNWSLERSLLRLQLRLECHRSGRK